MKLFSFATGIFLVAGLLIIQTDPMPDSAAFAIAEKQQSGNAVSRENSGSVQIPNAQHTKEIKTNETMNGSGFFSGHQDSGGKAQATGSPQLHSGENSRLHAGDPPDQRHSSGHSHDQGHHHGHEHGQGHSRTHGNPHSHGHTHHLVDYTFREDAGRYTTPEPNEDGYVWWKGNLHTHTLWSDGDQFPEVVTQWYYEHGYNFLSLSDHNVLSRGQRWINPETNVFAERAGGLEVYELYRERFGDDWIETRERNGELQVRLKPLNEVRSLFEHAGRFIMIESEEITEREHIVHVNATNILDLIEPRTGSTVEETIRLNIDAVIDQRDRTGQEMLPHLNHPNFRRAVTAEDMVPVENLRLFEIYNGHRGVLNFGDNDGVKDLDRLWDIVLTRRLGEMNLGPVYGVAVDDAHHYESSGMEVARPGRGWIRVRSRFLTPEHIIQSLESGDFYSSSGVNIRDVRSDGNRYEIEIDAEENTDYTILFIGTREGYDNSSEPFTDAEGQVRDDRTRLYSRDIGEILKETTGTRASYEFQGDELYVRAKVISSKIKENYFFEGEREKAWLQPVLPGHRYGELVE